MKIEKLNENKIRVTFNSEDLQKNNIDIHSFMSNSIESQNMFLVILDKAEREVGFITDNYKLSIEAIALSNGTFIVTVTRIKKELQKKYRVHAHKKNIHNTLNERLIFKFSNYDDLTNLEKFLVNSDEKLFNKFSNSYLLYEYNNNILLIIENLVKMNVKNITRLTSILSEFAVQIQDSEFLIEKIYEFGKKWS